MKRALSGQQLAKLIAEQVGRYPMISFEVAVPCRFGWPAVIKSEPFTEDGAPNPNLYYLTCPYLHRELAVLEELGMIRSLEKLFAADDDLGRQLLNAQIKHAHEWESLAGVKWPGGEAGTPRIAAVSNGRMLKCLHAHMAWFLVYDDYGPGRIICDAVGERWCDDELCKRYLLA